MIHYGKGAVTSVSHKILWDCGEWDLDPSMGGPGACPPHKNMLPVAR